MNIKQNPDGSWSEARAMGYFADLRPLWKKVLEVPLRLLGVVRYDPLTEIPVEEMVWDVPEPNTEIARSRSESGASNVRPDEA